MNSCYTEILLGANEHLKNKIKLNKLEIDDLKHEKIRADKIIGLAEMVINSMTKEIEDLHGEISSLENTIEALMASNKLLKERLYKKDIGGEGKC